NRRRVRPRQPALLPARPAQSPPPGGLCGCSGQVVLTGREPCREQAQLRSDSCLCSLKGMPMLSVTSHRGWLAGACIALLGAAGVADACTRFVYHGAGNEVMTARSMDYKIDTGTHLWVFPR